jgi:hypothetical protein
VLSIYLLVIHSCSCKRNNIFHAVHRPNSVNYKVPTFTHTFRNITTYKDISWPVTNVTFHINILFCGIKYNDIYMQLYMSQYIYEVYDKNVCIGVFVVNVVFFTYSWKVKFKRSHSIAKSISEVSIIILIITSFSNMSYNMSIRQLFKTTFWKYLKTLNIS